MEEHHRACDLCGAEVTDKSYVDWLESHPHPRPRPAPPRVICMARKSPMKATIPTAMPTLHTIRRPHASAHTYYYVQMDPGPTKDHQGMAERVKDYTTCPWPLLVMKSH